MSFIKFLSPPSVLKLSKILDIKRTDYGRLYGIVEERLIGEDIAAVFNKLLCEDLKKICQSLNIKFTTKEKTVQLLAELKSRELKYYFEFEPAEEHRLCERWGIETDFTEFVCYFGLEILDKMTIEFLAIVAGGLGLKVAGLKKAEIIDVIKIKVEPFEIDEKYTSGEPPYNGN